MEIGYKDYLITSGPADFTLSQVCVYGSESTKAGETYARPIGYFPSIEALAFRLMDIEMLESEPKTIEDLVETVKRFKKEIIQMCKEFGSKWKPVK